MSRTMALRLAVAGMLALGIAQIVSAQIGKKILVRAGTPEDKALMAIDSATALAEKVDLLDKFMAEFGQSEFILHACDRYILAYAAEKQYDKAFEYAAKGLAYDPENLALAMTTFRAAQESGSLKHLVDWGERVGGIVQAYKKKNPPEGIDAAAWEEKKSQSLKDASGEISYVEYTLFNAGVTSKDPAQKAEILDRFSSAFPGSPYASDAATVAADAYRQARNTARMLEFAQRTLARDPSHVGMLLLLSEHWTENKEQFDKAEEYARRALDLLARAQKPAQATEEQWKQQVELQSGLAYSALGQIHVNRKRDAQAVDALRLAAPLLRPYDFYYARNQYVLGFALLNLRRTAEAKPVFTEAAGLNTPYRPLAQAKLNELAGPARPAKKKR